ncbi:MAG: CHAP domain-containing protein [Caulobacteraceae bacterium]|nr:CHAP domain-containing protein [Caulobacter sp.]
MVKRTTVAMFAAAFTLLGASASQAAATSVTDLLQGVLRPQAPAAPAAAVNPAANQGWQCAQFARLFTGIQIFGDAGTWWEKAVGKYARGFTPQAGSVLVFRPYGPMTRGHVAVVSQVLTDRIIQVTHANWSLINGRRGQVEKDVTVVDVSPGGDWSQVKVWYDPTNNLGTTVYPTYGFIYKAQQVMQAATDAMKSAASRLTGSTSAEIASR